MSKDFQGGLVGFGAVTEAAHVPALKAAPNLSIIAIAESSPERRKAAANAFPKARLYESMDAMLAGESDLDFVVIATPPVLHGEQTLRAIRAGCHVLCEKPLTLNLEQFESIKREAAAANLTAFTVHNWALSPQWRKIYEIVESGAMGELRHVELHTLRTQPASGAKSSDWRSDPAQAGGGILVDHGWHSFYLLRRLLKDAPSRVTGRLAGPDAGVEHDATVFLEYPSATALLHLSWRSALRSNTALVFGTKGLLELDDDRLTLHGAEGAVERFEFPEKLSAGSAHPEWTAGIYAAFSEAMADPMLRAGNLDESGFCFKMINRVYVSVRHGRSPIREALTKPRERS